MLRFAARSMLASFFVVNGVKAVRHPETLVAEAQPIANKVVPLAKRVAPAQVAEQIPEETRDLVKISGAMQIAGGVALATGFGRRLGATALALSMVPHVAASQPFKGRTAEEKERNRSLFLRNLALLGGVILAAQDTQGKPSLGWRAADAQRRLSHAADRQLGALDKSATKAAKRAEKSLRKAQKQAKKQLG